MDPRQPMSRSTKSRAALRVDRKGQWVGAIIAAQEAATVAGVIRHDLVRSDRQVGLGDTGLPIAQVHRLDPTGRAINRELHGAGGCAEARQRGGNGCREGNGRCERAATPVPYRAKARSTPRSRYVVFLADGEPPTAVYLFSRNLGRPTVSASITTGSGGGLTRTPLAPSRRRACVERRQAHGVVTVLRRQRSGTSRTAGNRSAP